MDYQVLASGYWYEMIGDEFVPVPDSGEQEQAEPSPAATIDPDFIEVSNMLRGEENENQTPTPTITPTPTPTPTASASPSPSPTSTAATETITDEDMYNMVTNGVVAILGINFTLCLILLYLFINKFLGN